MSAKQKIYTWSILLGGGAAVLPIGFLIIDRDPHLLLHLALDLPILVFCLIGWILVRARRIVLVERLMLGVIVSYILAWDVANLTVRRLPSQSNVVSNAPVFLLGCIMLCLILPIRDQRRGLLVFTAVHVGLTWVNLLRFEWGPAHVGQLTTDVTTMVSVLLLSLIGLYQLQLVLAEKRADHLREQANTDSLTGLLNRRALYPVLQRPGSMAVALIDLDDFKAVNDMYGHPYGDAELVLVAQVLTELTGHRGLVARWGGEEFLVALPGLDLVEAAAWAESARREVERRPDTSTTLSIGVTVARPVETKARLLSRVDALLYQAKRQGKNCVVAGADPPPRVHA